MMPDDLTATAIAAAVRTGSRLATDVVAEALTRAAEDRSNAVVTICGAAAERDARAIDEAIDRGEDPGPLAGVPFTVKDTIMAAGVRTTAGSRLLADHVAEGDAECVRRLRSAGAVLIGKTNCPEFALQAHTDNLVFGATVHPHAPGMSPGGSSGGCAAAVAGGVVPLTLGGDYGGSVRYPASCTGIFGLRPTRGALDPGGTLPVPAPGTPRYHFQTIGPLARSVDDVALAFDVLRSAPVSDSTVTRIGVVTGGWPVDESGRRAVEGVAAASQRAGFDVSEVSAEVFVRAAAVFDSWRATDTYDDVRRLTDGREAELTPHIRALLATRRAPPTNATLAAIARAAEELERVVADLLVRTPVVVLPIALVGVLPLGTRHVLVDGRAEPLDSLRILDPARAVSLLGLPALAVPAGVDERGLPVGVQLVGRPHAESDLFSVARALASTP